MFNKSLTATKGMYNSFVAVSPDSTTPDNTCLSEKVCEKWGEIIESIRKRSQSWTDIVLISNCVYSFHREMLQPELELLWSC